MAMSAGANRNPMPMMDSSYYFFTKARFFAGLFAVQQNHFCQKHQ